MRSDTEKPRSRAKAHARRKVKDLDLKDADTFFHMLAYMNSGGCAQDEILIDKFVSGCIRMQGVAAAIDLHTLRLRRPDAVWPCRPLAQYHATPSNVGAHLRDHREPNVMNASNDWGTHHLKLQGCALHARAEGGGQSVWERACGFAHNWFGHVLRHPWCPTSARVNGRDPGGCRQRFRR